MLKKKRIEFYERNGFYKLNCDISLYNEIYSLYMFPISKFKENKKKTLKEIFEIYSSVLGEKEMKDNFQII